MAERTFRVSEFASEVRGVLRSRLPASWLTGEVQRLRRSGRGHLYFELVEKGPADDVLAKLEAVVWRSDLEQIESELARQDQRLAEGIEIRCRAEVDFYPPFGRLQIVVRRVDPEFTMGLLSRRRRETIKALAAAGLLELNKQLELPAVPLRVGLITSFDSAAYHDFVSTLRQSSFGFDVRFLHSAVQGRDAEAELIAAVRRAASLDLDCLVLIRGGGSRTDLAVFDSRRLAEALARSPVPVVAGLGHEIDESVADLVAHTRAKTPTQAAQLLVSRLQEAEGRVRTFGDRVSRAAREPLAASRVELSRLVRELAMVRYRVAGAAARTSGLAERFAAVAGGRLASARDRAAGRGSQLRALAAVRLRQAESRLKAFSVRAVRASAADLRRRSKHLGALERLCRQLSPERTLRRGFSITRTEDGKVVRSPDQARPGIRLQTQLADGTVRSRVESP